MTARQARPFTQAFSLLWPVPAVLFVSLAVMVLPQGSALRLLMAGVALLFLPGYALTLAAFPGSRTQQDDVKTPFDRRFLESTLSSLDPIERLALAVGFSVALMPVYGYVVGLEALGLAYEPRTAIILVSAATALCTTLASIRYLSSPTDIVVPSPFAHLAETIGDEAAAPTSGKRILNVAVIVMLVLATASLAAAMASPAESPEYTTAVLLTENDDGELVADGYPDELRTGETADLAFRVENHESREVEYHVVAQLQRVNSDGIVTEISVIDQFDQTLAPGQMWEQEHRVTSEMSGERVRLTYLVYKGDVPSEPTLDNSYRNLTLWVGTADGGDV